MKKKDVYIRSKVHTWSTNLHDIGFAEIMIEPKGNIIMRGSTYHYIKKKK